MKLNPAHETPPAIVEALKAFGAGKGTRQQAANARDVILTVRQQADTWERMLDDAILEQEGSHASNH